MKKLKILFLLLCINLAGCRLEPPYVPPCIEVPEDWKGDYCCNQETAPCLESWWEVFNDETLNELEEEAIQNNPTLYIACERVQEYRAIAAAYLADSFPQVVLTPNSSNTGMLFKLFLPPGLAPSPLTLDDVFRIKQTQIVLPLTLNYEVDFWGKLRNNYNAAAYSAEAQEEAYRTSLLTLTTDLANSYFLKRSLDTQVDILSSTVASRKKEFELTQQRYDNGLANKLDLSSASLQLTNAESTYYDTVRQRELQVNLIAALVGTPASNFCLEPFPLLNPPPCIPPLMPSEVLLQRPDIAEAERMMEAQNALIGSARAAFLPSLNLTGTLGFLSPDMKNFLTWQSRLWSYGGTINQVVFDGGRVCSNVQSAWARFGEASGEYQQRVLTAFREVEDALNNIEMQSKQSESLAKSVSATALAANISNKRYKSGLTQYFDVIGYEELKLDAQRNEAILLGARYQSTIQLIKAIGGCW